MAVRFSHGFNTTASENTNAPTRVSHGYVTVVNNDIPTHARVAHGFVTVVSDDAGYGVPASLGGMPGTAPAGGGISF